MFISMNIYFTENEIYFSEQMFISLNINLELKFILHNFTLQLNILDSILIFVPNIWGSFQVWSLFLGQKHNC